MATASPLRILVVDDNQDWGELVELYLLGLGHEVKLVLNGTAAVRYARTHHPDLILMDIGMPGRLNGFEATRQIKASGKKKPTIVAVTGWGRAQDVERGIAAGVDKHVTKPFDFQLLHGILDSVSRPASRGAKRRSTKPTFS